MSELSEQAYCAGWMQGLEDALWNAVVKGRVKDGRLQITRAHTLKLKELSDRCGGWIVWGDDLGEAFMPLDQWQKKYEAKHGFSPDRLSPMTSAVSCFSFSIACARR